MLPDTSVSTRRSARWKLNPIEVEPAAAPTRFIFLFRFAVLARLLARLDCAEAVTASIDEHFTVPRKDETNQCPTQLCPSYAP